MLMRDYVLHAVGFGHVHYVCCVYVLVVLCITLLMLSVHAVAVAVGISVGVRVGVEVGVAFGVGDVVGAWRA